jgi:putative ABC transport system ATP-binding protein
MLSMKNVCKVFRIENIETHALRDFDLEVAEGDFLAVAGPSGSGKTTFLNIAGLLETFTSGEYWLDGKEISKLCDKEMSAIRNTKIGFIFQGFNLLPDLNLFDNVDVPLRYQRLPAAERKERIHACLDTVGLASRMKHLPAQLSGGQQQRVAIARALASQPRFLLADEPTGNLDSTMARQVVELLQQINQQGTTIIMVTHDPELAGMASRKIELMDGRINDPLEESTVRVAAN